MQATKFLRKRNIIREGEVDKVFPSISAAKRESRVLQQSNGGLGCGVLRVVTKFPALEGKVNE